MPQRTSDSRQYARWRLCSSNAANRGVVVALAVAVVQAAGAFQIITDSPNPSFAAADPNDHKYVISLFDDADKVEAALPANMGPGRRFIVMTNAVGERYNCSLPAAGMPPDSTDRADSTAGGTAAQVKSDGDGTSPAGAGAAGDATTMTPLELLDSHMAALCWYHKDEKWTYEVCYKKHVRQFRKDPLGQLVEEFTCGRYMGDDHQSGEVLEDSTAAGHPTKYVAHRFDSGSSCALNNQRRTAEVRFTCNRDGRVAKFSSVREFPSCNYLIVIAVPVLCNHPALTPPEDSQRFLSCARLPMAAHKGAPDKDDPIAAHAVDDPTPVISTSSAPAAAAQSQQQLKAAAIEEKRELTDFPGVPSNDENGHDSKEPRRSRDEL